MALDDPVAALDSGNASNGIHATLEGQIRYRNRVCREISQLGPDWSGLAAQSLAKTARLGPLPFRKVIEATPSSRTAPPRRVPSGPDREGDRRRSARRCPYR